MAHSVDLLSLYIELSFAWDSSIYLCPGRRMAWEMRNPGDRERVLVTLRLLSTEPFPDIHIHFGKFCNKCKPICFKQDSHHEIREFLFIFMNLTCCLQSEDPPALCQRDCRSMGRDGGQEDWESLWRMKSGETSMALAHLPLLCHRPSRTAMHTDLHSAQGGELTPMKSQSSLPCSHSHWGKHKA